MNQIQMAAFELQLTEVTELQAAGHDLSGCLLAASSAHDPSPEEQRVMIRFLEQSGASVNETDKNGVTPLHRAVRFRSPEAVALLLEFGADLSATDKKSGSTPLHRAVTNTGAPATAGKKDHAIQIVKILLGYGADPKAKNRKGLAPIDYAKNDELRAALRP